MRAAVYDRYGDPEVIRIKEIDKPVPLPGEVLVKIYAVSVNPVDWKVVSGKLKIFTGRKFPKLTGIEGSGTVEETGAGVTTLKKGQRVFVALDYNGGVCAEFVKAPADRVVPLSDGVTYEEACTMAIAGITALQGLRDNGKIKPGMKILINGASGGVGTYAVQIAKAYGAVVTAVCSSKNSELVKRLGADDVIDYGKEDFISVKKSYDIIFDAVGNKSLWQVRKILKKRGVFINISPSIGLYLASAISRMFPGKKSVAFMLKPVMKDLSEIMKMIVNKNIRVVIDRVYSFEETSKAFQYSKTERARGKIVIMVKQEVVGLSELC